MTRRKISDLKNRKIGGFILIVVGEVSQLLHNIHLAVTRLDVAIKVDWKIEKANGKTLRKYWPNSCNFPSISLARARSQRFDKYD